MARGASGEARPLGGVMEGSAGRDVEPEGLAELRQTLEEADRRRLWLRGEAEWFRRLGWRLVRPLLALAILAALVMTLQTRIEPTVGLTLVLSGAGGFYIVLQLYVAWWSRRRPRELERIQRQLALELGSSEDGAPDK